MLERLEAGDAAGAGEAMRVHLLCTAALPIAQEVGVPAGSVDVGLERTWGRRGPAPGVRIDMSVPIDE